MSSTLNLWPVLERRDFLETDDETQLRRDWEAIGRDWHRAISETSDRIRAEAEVRISK